MIKKYFVDKYLFDNKFLSVWILCDKKYCIYIQLDGTSNSFSKGGLASEITKKIATNIFTNDSDLFSWIIEQTGTVIMSELDVVKFVLAYKLNESPIEKYDY